MKFLDKDKDKNLDSFTLNLKLGRLTAAAAPWLGKCTVPRAVLVSCVRVMTLYVIDLWRWDATVRSESAEKLDWH